MSEFTKYIDSVVGNIARKIEDEFNENDHPRDKGGKFTSAGGEGKGGSKKEIVPETETEKAAKEELNETSSQEFEKVTKQLDEVDIDLASMMEDLGVDTSNIPEAYLRQAFEEEMLGNSTLTSRALKYINAYRNSGTIEAQESLEDASPKKNRLGRNPLEKINPNEDDSLDNTIFKKTGK